MSVKLLFSFSKNGYHFKDKELSLPNFLPEDGEIIAGYITFLSLGFFFVHLSGLFNAKAIHVEEHSWEDKEVHTFSKDINPKVKLMALLDFELSHQYFSHYTTGTHPFPKGISALKNTHTHIYKYVFVCVCVHLCVYVYVRMCVYVLVRRRQSKRPLKIISFD